MKQTRAAAVILCGVLGAWLGFSAVFTKKANEERTEFPPTVWGKIRPRVPVSPAAGGAEKPADFELAVRQAVELEISASTLTAKAKLEVMKSEICGRWSSLNELLVVSRVAHLLILSPVHLEAISGGMKTKLSAMQRQRVFEVWTSQASAEFLYESMPSSERASLCRKVTPVQGIFGSRLSGVFDRDLKELGTLDRAKLLLALEIQRHDETLTGVFSKEINRLSGSERAELIEYLKLNWATMQASTREGVLPILFKSIPAAELHDFVRTAVRFYAADLVLQEYGTAIGRGSVQDLVNELATWTTEPSKRKIIMGFFGEDRNLTRSEGDLLLSIVDDSGMRERIQGMIKEEP
jgi:hypothetical protein